MRGFTGNLQGGADGKAWYVGGLTTDVQRETVCVCKLQLCFFAVALRNLQNISDVFEILKSFAIFVSLLDKSNFQDINLAVAYWPMKIDHIYFFIIVGLSISARVFVLLFFILLLTVLKMYYYSILKIYRCNNVVGNYFRGQSSV